MHGKTLPTNTSSGGLSTIETNQNIKQQTTNFSSTICEWYNLDLQTNNIYYPHDYWYTITLYIKSGQSNNFTKSKIYFSTNTTIAEKSFVLTSFKMREGILFGKYLCFPLFVNKSTSCNFQYILNNFKAMLWGWKTNILSIVGRTTLIKSTLNSLPNYVMQYIKIPSQVILRMNRYQRKFLWGIIEHKKKIHLIN